MPKDPTIKSVLVIGSGPIVIGQACEFDYSGTQAVKALRSEGIRVSLVNSNPATIMTDPEYADRTYIEPLTPEAVETVLERERPDALLPTVGGQTALNLAVELSRRGVLDRLGVRLIGASRRAVEVGEDRQLFKEAMARIGLDVPTSGFATSLEEARAVLETTGLPAVIRPSFTLGGTGGGIAYNSEEFEELAGRGIDLSPDEPDPHRGVRARLEGVRARGHAGQGRQLRGDLLHRELRPDGHPHRGLGHRGAGPDPHRPRVPGDAQRLAGHHQRGRGGDRRLQHPVRRRPEDRAPDGDRDEPAGLPLLGPGQQGHRVPHRQDRGAAGHRLSPRRDPERHHPGDPGQLRAGHRLRGGEDPALGLREVPRRQPAPRHPDEVGGRGHGHRAHLQGGAAEGAAGPRDRDQRLRPDRPRPRPGSRRSSWRPTPTGSST